MIYPQRDTGILVVVSRGDKRATFQVGSAWQSYKQSFGRILNETLMPGMIAGRESETIRQAVEQIVVLVDQALPGP